MFIELYFGFFHNSLALVSDAIHNIGDVLGLLVAWLGFYLAQHKNMKKISDITALVNTLFIIFGALFILHEAYQRWNNPAGDPVAKTIIGVALVGFIINFYTANLFHHGHHHQNDESDLNIKSAYLHLLSDAIISLGVAVVGVIIYFTSLYWLDPVISVVISVIVLYSSFKLLKEIILKLVN